MPSKYDTNPLDPEFPEKAGATRVFEKSGAETTNFPPVAETEEQTRRFATSNFSAYQQPNNGEYVPVNVPPAGFGDMSRTGSRKVAKIGLPENIVTALPYLPWMLGLIAGVILLIVVPRTEPKVRFHAAQGLAAHAAILAVATILGIVGNVSDFADIGNAVFSIVMTVMLIIATIKAFRGKPVHIESVDSLTNWFEQKIDPKLIGS